MTPAKSTPCIIYCRVSTREQGDSGHGLDSQEDRCRQEALRRGWPVHSAVHETISGDKAARPKFREACDLARELGGVLLAAEASRLTRQRGGVVQLYEQAAKDGWAVYALDMPEIDVTSPMGEAILTIISAINRLERRVTGQRTSAALRAKVKRGERVGRPRALDQDKRPEERKRAEAAIPRLLELRASGLSLERTALALNAEGVEGLHGGRWWKRSVHMAERRYGG